MERVLIISYIISMILRGWEKRESRIAKYERRMGGKV